MKVMRRISVRVAYRIAALVCPILLCAAAPAFSQAVKDLPKPTNYVNDYAHVMSSGAQDQLNQLCLQVDQQAHAKIVVLTIDTTNGEPIQQYSVELEDNWKIGTKGSDRWVLVLFAVKDRRRFIYPGYGLEGILPDGKVGDIGRQMVPMLRNNDFDGAVTLAVDEMAQIIAQDAGVTLQPLTRWGAAQQRPHATAGQIIGGILFLIFVVIFLIWAGGNGLLGFLLGMFFGGGRWGGGGGGFGGGGFGGDGGGGGGGFDIGGSGGGGGAGAGGGW
jgi:uncharacterized protein